MRSTIAALVAALLIAGPVAASAQDPSYAQPASGGGGGDAQIRGRIVNFDGGYSLQVRDDKGYVDSVQLHPGTIINPTGITLAPGMVVSVLGYNAGSSFDANEVDTPYTYYGGSPYYEGHPWNYYGDSYGLTFFFGGNNNGWWHGNQFGGNSYRYNNGVRQYNNVQINSVYHGGGYQSGGRSYAAPQSRGGYYSGQSAGRQGGGSAGYHGSSGGGQVQSAGHSASGGGGGAAHAGGGGGHR
jgi:hypothetical protein